MDILNAFVVNIFNTFMLNITIHGCKKEEKRAYTIK